MNKQQAARQRIRKALIIVSLLLFPVIMNYLSPYVIIDGASQGIVNGSLIVFGLQFLSALFVGRLWCGWACPAAGLGEVCFAINDRPVRARLDWIKWLIWVPWLALIVTMAVRAGGYRQVDFFHLTESGVSVDEPAKYVIYYIVVVLFAGLSVTVGRRAGCHTICWMAPFMILGRALRNVFGWPALRLKAEREQCIQCKRCTQNCPMSLDVNGLVQGSTMEHSECILCGTCVDVCPKDAIRYSFSGGK
ncbi:MAG: 4Fe-4S binding protein [Anaerolineae bacterium]|jgi:ferredoxin-type protein NapH|nr:4Fe-4S binding protein [Anaerolineae bacterium]